MKKLFVLMCALWFSTLVRAEEAPFKGIDLISGELKTVEWDPPQPAPLTVFIFLSARCPCSNSHIPSLKQLAQTFSSSQFQFMGVHSNSDEPVEEARVYFKEQAKLNFPILSDPQSQLANRLKAFKTPHVFIWDPHQKTFLFDGGVDDSREAQRATHFYLKDALTALQKGQTVPRPRVRVLGCQIQRPPSA